MADVLYFADALLERTLSARLRDSGLTLRRPELSDRLRLRRLDSSAILVDGDSSGSQAVIRAAKQAGIPVVMICQRSSERFLRDELLADTYLEKPVTAAEVAAALIELINDGWSDDWNRRRGANDGTWAMGTRTAMRIRPHDDQEKELEARCV
jgi:DNA-binding response OmpR family regulator